MTATLAVLLPLGWYWRTSLLPSTYSVMDMGYADYGDVAARAGAHVRVRVITTDNGPMSTCRAWWKFVADNPGIWMDHCHNLPHAAQGLVAHLMYEGATEPFRVGGRPSQCNSSRVYVVEVHFGL